MCRLIESVRLYNGEFSRLILHQKRMERAWDQIFNKKPIWNLEEILSQSNPPAHGLYKCRIIYDHVSFKIEYEPYRVKPIHSLKLVENNEINYHHKYENRDTINELFNLRGSQDDVLIVKNNFITDTSYANIVFQKNNQWFTPDSPLLYGTMRQFLLDSRVISLTSIRKNDIINFECFKLINSMLEWSSPSVAISKILIE